MEKFITVIPTSALAVADDPDSRIKDLTKSAAIKAAVVSASLSAPGGIVGILSTLPDLAAIWKIQAQLVADIAAVYGKLGYLSKQSLLWCLCKQSGAQVVRDIAVRAGTHVLLKKTALKSLSRIVPVVGAFGSGAYAAFDTYEVSRLAKRYFQNPEKAVGLEIAKHESADH